MMILLVLIVKKIKLNTEKIDNIISSNNNTKDIIYQWN